VNASLAGAGDRGRHGCGKPISGPGKRWNKFQIRRVPKNGLTDRKQLENPKGAIYALDYVVKR